MNLNKTEEDYALEMIKQRSEEEFLHYYEELYPNVQNGALMLDENEPEWWREINLSTLDISSSEYCICGQAFQMRAMETDYTQGYDWATSELKPVVEHGAEFFGFCADKGIEYQMLDYLWTQEIKYRWEVLA